MMAIASPRDLERANIALAWSFAHKMTAEHFEQLCRVTVQQWRPDTEEDVPGSTPDVPMPGVVG